MASQAPRPQVQTQDTLDSALQLSGTLTRSGIAELDIPEKTVPTSAANGSAISHDHARANAAESLNTSDSAVSEEDDEEDYDAKPLDPAVIVNHPAADARLATSNSSDRRSSIPIKLEKTDKRGRYILSADESEIREIVRRGLERDAKNARQKKSVRELVFTRRFTTFDSRNPTSSDSAFKGFFVLFWLAMALLLLRVAAQNYRQYGSVLGPQQIARMMFSKDVILLGIVDGIMALSTVFGLALQKIIAKGYLHWERSGWIIQNLWQTFYILGFIAFAFYRDWPWTHTIFVMLHGFVFLMKQHSYAFYNGYLSQVLRRKQLLERKLADLRARSPPTSPVSPTATFASTTGALQSQLNPTAQASESIVRHRRKSSRQEKANLSYETPEIAAAAQIISSGAELSLDQYDSFSDILSHELDELNKELKGKCQVTQNYYPKNLTLFNLAEWTCLPTLVYELEYPRQEKIHWIYVAEKAAATLGGIFIMSVISQAYIYPSVAETMRMKEAGMPIAERWKEFPWVVSDMLFPMLLEQLLTWYVIWECLLNLLAELTLFADRGFYGDWWNSVSWDQYARDWNRPVHNFLLRHVYHSSISAMHLSKGSATFVTFLLSALVHELAMFCIFKKVRGYLFAMQLMQMPLVMMSRLPAIKAQKTLGNIIFWIGLFVGPSVLTSLYLIV